MNSRTLNILIALVLAIACCYLLGQLEGIPLEGVLFPRFILYALLGCSVLLATRSVFPTFKKERIAIFEDIPFFLWILVAGFFLFYAVGVFYIGFYTATFLATMGTLTAMSGSKRIRAFWRNVLFSLGLSVFFYLFFGLLLKVPFPEGMFI